MPAETTPKPGSRDAIAAHAQKLLDQGIKDGKIVADSAGALAAAAMPSFSEGTLAIDDNTGKPIIPGNAVTAPQITDGTHIDPNATGALGPEATGEEQAAAQAAAAGRANAPRDDKGQFIGDKPKEPAAAPASPPPAIVPADRAAAADAAAATILDEWADHVDLSFEQDDGTKYTVRAKKGDAPQIERFNRRQAQVDRHASWMAKYRPTLEPLISEGRLDPILPVLQRALGDKDFGDAVVEMYNRRVTGAPLFPTAAAPPAGAPPASAPPAGAPPAAALVIPEITDPYIAETMAPVFASFQAQFAAQQARLDGWENKQTTTAREQQERANAERARNHQVYLGHQDLARKYPTMFTGDVAKDQAALTPIFRYAREGGYTETYGARAGVLLAAEAYMQSRAETGSPAADMLNTIDRTMLAGAAAQAGAARSVGGGSAAIPPARRPTAPIQPSPFDASGKRKDTRTHMAELQQYAEQLRQYQAAS